MFVSLLTGCGLLLLVIAFHFIIRAMTDLRVPVNRESLALAVSYFPDSPRLNARLGEAELSLPDDRDAAVGRADMNLARAVAWSPYEYRFRIVQASVREAQGDRSGAEQALREAVRLAPGQAEVHWRLANLLVRAGKLDQSLDDFRFATSLQPELLPGALDLVWNFSHGNVAAATKAVGRTVNSQLALAQFLLRKSNYEPALNIFNQTNPAARLVTPEGAASSAALVNGLIEAGRIREARQCWLTTLGLNADELLGNGSFETEIPKGFEQFAWRINGSEYARIGVNPSEPGAISTAHTGKNTLRIDFAGRDTTRLNDEVSHLLPVNPGEKYHLEYFVRAQNLKTPEGPRVALVNGSTRIAESEPAAAGSYEWRRVALDFTAPSNVHALQLQIRRIPKFTYDDPTSGSIWFDDFRVWQ